IMHYFSNIIVFLLLCISFFFFFFFSSRRRHTRSLRDWSSDVCSSDLTGFKNMKPVATEEQTKKLEEIQKEYGPQLAEFQKKLARSEERRVGKECRSRWWPCH